MFIPIWAVATLIYSGLILWIVFGGDRPTSIYDIGTPIVKVFFLFVATIAYLIFWIVYLAI